MNETFLTQAPTIIPVITDDRDFYINIVLSIITLLAVLVALLQEPIRKFLSKSKIKVEIRKTPPDCHQILLTNQHTGEAMGNTIYSRIRLTNLTRSNPAENVEVFISHFWKINSNENKKEITTFLPMNLKWSHTHEIKSTILPSFHRYCDFGSFRQADKKVFLILDTIVQPNPVSGGKVPNIIEAGKYEFQIDVSGSNIDPVSKRWKLEFNNKWHEDEDKMLKSIIIKEA